MTIALIALSTVLGLGLWTLLEYGLHRFAMHHRPGRDLISREHLVHHGDPAATSAVMRTLGHLGVASLAALGGYAASFLIAPAAAAGLAGGVAAGYSGYELLHWHAHHRAPRTAYGVRLRHRHFQHHFGSPRANYGVTCRIWDRVFGSDDPSSTVVVPRRMAMAWLCDDGGEIRPAHRSGYEIRSGRPATAEVVAEDRGRAFADEPPLP